MFPVVLGFLSAGEWVIVLLIVVLLFGAAKIPELARALGKAKGEFEKGAREGREPAGPRDAPPIEAEEAQRILRTAREMGVPTEGRSLSDIKADLRAKLT